MNRHKHGESLKNAERCVDELTVQRKNSSSSILSNLNQDYFPPNQMVYYKTIYAEMIGSKINGVPVSDQAICDDSLIVKDRIKFK